MPRTMDLRIRPGAPWRWLGWLAATCCSAVWGADYEYVVIKVEGGLATQATGINESGTVVGSYQQPQGPHVLTRPFVYKDGVYRIVRRVEPIIYSFDDINDRGHKVTNVLHRDQTGSASLMIGARKTTLAVPGAEFTFAYALNDADLVAGAYDHSPNELGVLTTSAYLWSQQSGYTAFDAPGAAGLTIAWGVNAAGTAVGVYADAALVYHGFIRAPDGSVTTLDYPGSPYTQLMGINARGDIVGFYQDPADYVLKGFLYRAGQFEPIAPPAAVYGSYPYRITEDGRIVGWYIDADGNVSSFFAKPGPAR